MPSFDEMTEAHWRRMLRRRSRKVAITLLSLAFACLISGSMLDTPPGVPGTVQLTWTAVLLATSSLFVLVVWMPLRDMYLRKKLARPLRSEQD